MNLKQLVYSLGELSEEGWDVSEITYMRPTVTITPSHYQSHTPSKTQEGRRIELAVTLFLPGKDDQ